MSIQMAREFVAGQSHLALSFAHPEGDVPCDVKHQSGNLLVTGGARQDALLLTAMRPTTGKHLVNLDQANGQPQIVQNDADSLVRHLVPAVLRRFDPTFSGQYENIGVGGWDQFDFRFVREQVVPNEHSYNEVARV